MVQMTYSNTVSSFIRECVNTFISEKTLPCFFTTKSGGKYLYNPLRNFSQSMHQYFNETYNEKEKEIFERRIHKILTIDDRHKEEVISYLYIMGLRNNVFLLTDFNDYFFSPVPSDVSKELMLVAHRNGRLLHSQSEGARPIRRNEDNVVLLDKYLKKTQQTM